MTEQNRKTLRSFYCRDYLWELFESMAAELGCSIDYLINESMRHYARTISRGLRSEPLQTNHSIPQGAPSSHAVRSSCSSTHYGHDYNYSASPYANRVGSTSPVKREEGANFDSNVFPYASKPRQERFPDDPAYRPYDQHAANMLPPRPSSIASAPFSASPPSPPSPPASRLAPSPPSPPASRLAPSPPSPPASRLAPSPPSPFRQRPTLYLVLGGQRYRMDNDEFIIGRGSRVTDLTIRDGNISRKHCAILYRGGKYFIKDLGSTNGVEYQGKRIDSKRIEEGDVFKLCEYELRFTYKS